MLPCLQDGAGEHLIDALSSTRRTRSPSTAAAGLGEAAAAAVLSNESELSDRSSRALTSASKRSDGVTGLVR